MISVNIYIFYVGNTSTNQYERFPEYFLFANVRMQE